MCRIVLFFILFPALASAFQLDWSGYYRARATYLRGLGDEGGMTFKENKTKQMLYGRQYAAFNSTARISDGLSLQANFLLSGFDFSTHNQADKKEIAKHKHPHQAMFLNSSRYKSNVDSRKMQDVRFLPTHFYTTYSNEFLQVDMGRQPFGFGLGITYSEGMDPLLPMYDVRDAVAVKIQYESFYVKPYAMIYNQDEFSGYGASFAVAGGYKTDNITAELLYKSKSYAVGVKEEETPMPTPSVPPLVPQTAAPGSVVPGGTEQQAQNNKEEDPVFKSKPILEGSTLNVYGKYKEGPLTAAVEWGFMDNDMKKSAGFASFSWKTDFYNTSLNLIGGYISGHYDLNLNYDWTLLLSTYLYPLTETEHPSKSRQKTASTGGFPTNCFVLTPYISFDLTDKHQVLVFHVWVSDQDALNFKSNDVGVVTTHKLAEGFKWVNTVGAVLKGASVSDFLVQTSAVVTF